MGACCMTSAGTVNIEKERQVIAAERRALDAEKALYQLQIQGQAGNQQHLQVAPPPPPQAQYLTTGSISVGMAVRVTSDAAHLQRTCQQTGVLTHHQRLEYMGKPARVLEVDRSRNVAKVEWEDANGYMPIASLAEIPDGDAPAASGRATSGEAGLRQLLGVLGELLQEGSRLPRETPRSSSDFHFHDCLKSIDVDDRKKVAVCVEDRDATIVTQEVFEAAGSYEFLVRLSRPEGGSGGDPFIAVGLVDDKPNGFSNHMIGKEDFKGAIGALCLGNSSGPGAMVHEGQIVGVAPAMQDGDLFGVLIRNGTARFVKNGEMFHSIGLQGTFRFGVSLCRRQQSVEIVGVA